jgi:hypothetical protein
MQTPLIGLGEMLTKNHRVPSRQLVTSQHPLVRELIEGLGLGGFVKRIEIDIKAGEPIQIRVTQLCGEDELEKFTTTFKHFELKEKE